MAKSRDQKARDLRFILGATIGVLLGGIIIAAAILQVISRGPALVGKVRPLAFGLESDVREKLEQGGPIFLPSPAGDDGFWIALEGGELVALLVRQPKPASCQLRWRDSKGSFLCDGRRVTTEHLARYRSFTGTRGDEKGSYMVALRDVEPPPAGPPAFATSTSTPTRSIGSVTSTSTSTNTSD